MNKNKKTNVIRILHFILGILILSGVGFALTTVTDNSVTVTTGNVTADWFVGKVNVSDIQNFVYNYNQTTASGDGSYNSTYDSFAYNQTTAGISYTDSIVNRTFNKSATDLYYSSIIWGYNQSSALQSQYGQFWYNQTISSQATVNPFNQDLNTTSESTLGGLNVSLTTSSGDRGPAVNIVSRNQNQSAVWITGNESNKGTLKIAHTGYAGDGTSSAISIDLQGAGTSSKGIFITSTTGGSLGNYLHVSNGSSNLYTLDNYQSRTFLQTHITYTNDSALLVEKTDGTDIFKIDTISDLVFTGTLRPRTNMTQDIGQASVMYRSAYFDQNVTARYFLGDGSLLTNLPSSSGGYNITYDSTSQDVTANRSAWFGTYNSTYASLISYNSTFNQTLTDSLYAPISAIAGSFNATYDATSQDVTANRTSWINNYNSSYDAKISYNSTFNQTLTDSLYATAGAGNASFNQTLTDSKYIQPSNASIQSNLTFNVAGRTSWFRFATTIPAGAIPKLTSIFTDAYGTIFFEAIDDPDGQGVSLNFTTPLVFSNSGLVSCDADTEKLETNAQGVLVCGTAVSGGSSYNVTYQSTSNDVTANRSLWFYNMSFNKSATDLYYSPITLGYNQTTPAISYVDSKNYITSSNVAYINISNNFARSQNVSGNLTIRSNDKTCLDGDACSKYIYYNGSNVIIQG